MKIENVKAEKLIPYEFNNKIHDETQVNRIANSIREFWFLQPLVIDQHNFWLASNLQCQTIIILFWSITSGWRNQKLWMKELPCVRVENLTDEQIKKFRILDNKLNESAWNEDNLKVEIQELKNFNIWELEISVEDLFPDLQIIWPDGFWEWFSLPDGEKDKFGQMKFILAEEQKELIEQAIKEVKETDLYKSQMNYWNENSNWNALYCIVSQWIALNQ